MNAEIRSKYLETLGTLQTSLESAADGVPKMIDIPSEGVSLLNMKNETFLSYLENLVFLLLIKIRDHSTESKETEPQGSLVELRRPVVEKLAELRLYLEKGVRPLEGRLKYQMDRVLKVAEESSKPVQSVGKAPERASKLAKVNADVSDSDISDSGSDDSESDEEDEVAFQNLRANRLAFAKPLSTSREQEKEALEASKTGVYRPPKITPTALPTTDSGPTKSQKPGRSATLDEFVADELSTAPSAMPSIGSTIRSGGRSMLTARERKEMDERTKYEEENMTRLPVVGKKKKGARAGGRGEFGGEDWRSLGDGADRIGRLVGKGRDRGNALERSRKRGGEGLDFGSKKRKF